MWIEEVNKVHAENIPKILVGNKQKRDIASYLDEVDQEKIADVCERHDLTYVETNVMTGDGIQEMLDKIMFMVYEHKFKADKILRTSGSESSRNTSFMLVRSSKY